MNTANERAGRPTPANASDERFSAEERAAMKERAKELQAARRSGSAANGQGERDVLKKIAEMPEPDRSMAERIHALVTTMAPELTPRTWYGMPAYAKNGKVICYFTPASKFKERYATFGFNDRATLDDGTMWPTAFALTRLTSADEARLGAFVKKAVGANASSRTATPA